MLYEDFYSNFSSSVADGDIRSANLSLMKELGNILVHQKQDFVYLLNESGIPATIDMTDVKLVDLFVKNIGTNKQLTLGTSMLVHSHNKQINADGDEGLDSESIKTAYNAMRRYYGETSNAEGDVPGGSTAKGAISGGEVGAIAGAVSDLSKFGSMLSQGSQKKKYGAMDMASKKQEAKSQITQQILAQRQAQIEAAQKSKEQSAKTTRTLLIVGGVVVGLGLLGAVIYAIKKGKK